MKDPLAIKTTKGYTTTVGEIKGINEESAERLAEACGHYYDNEMLKVLEVGTSLFYTGKFRKQRVPKYLWLTIPVIERHYYCDDWGEDYSDGGWLITTRRIRLFKIGTEVIKVPVKRRFKKGETIKFRRYGKLNAKIK